jgi:hypothetical protein
VAVGIDFDIELRFKKCVSILCNSFMAISFYIFTYVQIYELLCIFHSDTFKSTNSDTFILSRVSQLVVLLNVPL